MNLNKGKIKMIQKISSKNKNLFLLLFLFMNLLFLPLNFAKAENRQETYKQLNLFGDVFQRVQEQYVEEVTDKKLIESAISGMLQSLDPHSSYLSPESYKDMQVKTKGKFGGLGIEITMEDGFPFVTHDKYTEMNINNKMSWNIVHLIFHDVTF